MLGPGELAQITLCAPTPTAPNPSHATAAMHVCHLLFRLRSKAPLSCRRSQVARQFPPSTHAAWPGPAGAPSYAPSTKYPPFWVRSSKPLRCSRGLSNTEAPLLSHLKIAVAHPSQLRLGHACRLLAPCLHAPCARLIGGLIRSPGLHSRLFSSGNEPCLLARVFSGVHIHVQVVIHMDNCLF